MDTNTRLEGVEQTMLLPLWGRYSESKKEQGLLRDRKCIEIVEKAKFDFSGLEKRQNPASRLAWVARAWNIDRELAGLGVGEKESTVLCLGCGLDTAFYRLRPSAPVHWYDLDLPRVIEVRRKLLGEEPGCTMKAGSVPDAALYRDIPVRGNLVVLATGLLYYFSEADVGRIFENIATLGGPLHLVIDYCSAQGAALANKMVIQDCPGARMIWSAEGEADIAALHPRIRRVRTYPIFRHILPLLGPEEAKMAEMSDRMKIMSFAVIELG